MSEGLWYACDLQKELNHLEFEYVTMWVCVEQIETGTDNGASVSGDAFNRYCQRRYGHTYDDMTSKCPCGHCTTQPICSCNDCKRRRELAAKRYW